MKNEERPRTVVPGFAHAVLFSALAGAISPVAAQIPAEVIANPNLTAAETQRIFFDELVRQEVPPEIAALVTMDTEIVVNEPDHIQFVQTMIGGMRREVDIRFSPGPPGDTLRVPIQLDDGSMMLAERMAMRDNDNGYETSGTVYLPDAQPSAALLERWRSRESPWWAKLLGIKTAHAQLAGLQGVVMSYGDSVVGSAGNLIGVEGMNVSRVVNVAQQVIADPTVQVTRTVGTIATDVFESQTQPTLTPAQLRGQTVAIAGKALFDLGMLFWKDRGRRAQLDAWQDCADNPTHPLAQRARTEDPNYRRATTEAIGAARTHLGLNTGISAIAGLGNSVAQALLVRTGPAGPTMARGAGYLKTVQSRMLEHVADEYIMKDAGKGVVPCTPVCGPVYEPAPQPTHPITSEPPPAQWGCNPAALQDLVCEPIENASALNFTPGPEPERRDDRTCGPLRLAHFEYHRNASAAECSSDTCESQDEQAQFVATVSLVVNDGLSYFGETSGEYASSSAHFTRSSVRCGNYESTLNAQGKADMLIRAFPTIDNGVTGGKDTSAMPIDTSVVEVLFEGGGVTHSSYSKGGCDPPQSSTYRGDVGPIGCYFYGVPLQQSGYYVSLVSDDDPAAGRCTLRLSR